MRPVARIFIDSAIGPIIGPGAIGVGIFGPVLVNGLPAALLGDSITPHPPAPDVPTCAVSKIATGAFSPPMAVLFNGRPVARMGDLTTCGHPIMSGAFNVFAGLA
jgi:uncharacterized Zn-binding protein involved in type VI secretion